MSKRRKLVLTLPVDYSQQELDERRDRLSAAALEYDAVEDEKKSASSVYNEQLKALRGEMRQIAKQIHRKGEDRAIDCIAEMHTPSVGFKTVIRLDTGEVVKTEPMTDDERQENLFEEMDELERMYNTPEPPSSQTPPPQPEDGAQGEAGA